MTGEARPPQPNLFDQDAEQPVFLAVPTEVAYPVPAGAEQLGLRPATLRAAYLTERGLRLADDDATRQDLRAERLVELGQRSGQPAPPAPLVLDADQFPATPLRRVS